MNRACKRSLHGIQPSDRGVEPIADEVFGVAEENNIGCPFRKRAAIHFLAQPDLLKNWTASYGIAQLTQSGHDHASQGFIFVARRDDPVWLSAAEVHVHPPGRIGARDVVCTGPRPIEPA